MSVKNILKSVQKMTASVRSHKRGDSDVIKHDRKLNPKEQQAAVADRLLKASTSPTYKINYEDSEGIPVKGKRLHSQTVVGDEAKLKLNEAFSMTAQMEAEAFLQDGDWNGGYSVTPSFKKKPQVVKADPFGNAPSNLFEE